MIKSLLRWVFSNEEIDWWALNWHMDWDETGWIVYGEEG